jgi:hypothetical protein
MRLIAKPGPDPGYRSLFSVQWIRDVYPGFRIRVFFIPDAGSRGQKGTGSRIQIRNRDIRLVWKAVTSDRSRLCSRQLGADRFSASRSPIPVNVSSIFFGMLSEAAVLRVVRSTLLPGFPGLGGTVGEGRAGRRVAGCHVVTTHIFVCFQVSDGLRSFLDTTGQACGGDPEGLVPPPHLFPPTLLDTTSNLNATLAAVSQLLAPSEDSNYTEPCREVS